MSGPDYLIPVALRSTATLVVALFKAFLNSINEVRGKPCLNAPFVHMFYTISVNEMLDMEPSISGPGSGPRQPRQ